MGNVRFRMLSDFTKHGANLACTCQGCGRRGVVDRDRAARWFFLHRFPTGIEVIGGHLRSSSCGGRPDRIEATWEAASHPNWMATETQWKRLARRLRG